MNFNNNLRKASKTIHTSEGIRQSSSHGNLFKLQSYHHNNAKKFNDIQLPKVLSPKIPSEKLDPYFLVKQDAKLKVEQDEQNNFDFYQIKSPSNPITDLKAKNKNDEANNKKNFKSIHQVFDQNLIRDTKFFSPRNYNELEQKERSELKKNGKILFLGEIYQQMDKDFDAFPKSATTTQYDQNTIENLEQWQQKNVIKKDKDKNQLAFQMSKRNSRLILAPSQFFYKTINSFQSEEPNQFTQKVQVIKTFSKTTMKQSILRALTIQGIVQNEENEISSQTQALQRLQVWVNNNVQKMDYKTKQQIDQNAIQDIKTLYELNQPNNNKEIKQDQNGYQLSKYEQIFNENFETQYQKLMAMVQQRKYQEINESNRDLKKLIKNYLYNVPDIEDHFVEISFQKITPQQIKETLQARFLLGDAIHGIKQRSQFFQKQTQVTEQRLRKIIYECETSINTKFNYLKKIRLEIHLSLNRIQENLQKNKSIQNQIERKNNPKLKQENTQKQKKNLIVKGVFIEQQDDERQQIKQNNENDPEQLLKIIEKNKQDNILFIQQIKDFTDQSQCLEKEIHQKQKDLKKHYECWKTFLFELLKIGKDFRENGITWVLKELYIFGYQIDDSHLPNFLDALAKQFLFSKLQLNQQITQYNEILKLQLDIFNNNNQNNYEQNNINIYTVQSNKQDFNNTKLTDLNNKTGIMKNSKNQIEQNNNLNQQFFTLKADELKQKDSEKLLKAQKQNNLVNEYCNLPVNKDLSTKINQNISEFCETKLTSNEMYYSEGHNIIKNQFKIAQQQKNLQRLEQKILKAQQFQLHLIEGEDLTNSNDNQENQKMQLTDNNENFNSNSIKKTINISHSMNKSRNNQLINNQSNLLSPITQVSQRQQSKTLHEDSSKQQQVQEQQEKQLQLALNDSFGNSTFQVQNNQIAIFQDDKQQNYFKDNTEFLDLNRKLKLKIENLEKELQKISQNEVSRIVNEFDFKNYKQKYEIDCPTLLASLFGYKQAQQFIIQYGLDQQM